MYILYNAIYTQIHTYIETQTILLGQKKFKKMNEAGREFFIFFILL